MGDDEISTGFGARLLAARQAAQLSPRRLAKQSGVDIARLGALERGAAAPTDVEIGVLAQACQVSVFDLAATTDSLRVVAADADDPRDALLREYLSMVVELRSGRVIAPPTLRRDDVVELAAALGDTPEAVEAHLLQLLERAAQPSAEAWTASD